MKHLKEFNINDGIINEGLRSNIKYLSLDRGEHSIEDVLYEVTKLKNDLESWLEDGWNIVTSKDIEHKEIIPYK